MQKLFSTTALAAMMAVGVIGGAAAVPLSGTFNVTVYNYNNPSPGNGGASTEQALPGAQAGGSNMTSSTFTYTGPINFLLGATSLTNTIASFIQSAGGAVTNLTGSAYNQTGSTSGFDITSLFKFSFTTPVALSGFITHDDGVSLFASGDTTNNLIPGNAAPTVAVNTAYSIGAGSYDLYYTEANNLPSQLKFDVPEPATFALLGTGLIGVGLLTQRRRAVGGSASA